MFIFERSHLYPDTKFNHTQNYHIMMMFN